MCIRSNGRSIKATADGLWRTSGLPPCTSRQITCPRRPPPRLVLGHMPDGTARWRAEVQPVLDTLSGEMLKDVIWMLRHCPDSAETDIGLAQELVRPRPGRAPMRYPSDANNMLALSLLNRGHLRDGLRVLRDKPIIDGGSGFFFTQLTLLGVVPNDTAVAQFRRWLRGPDLGPTVIPLAWWASQGDTSSIQAMIDRSVAAARAGEGDDEARNQADEFARIGRTFLALARHDTAEVWRRLSVAPDWHDITFLRARLFAAQGKDSQAAAVLDRVTWEGPLNVLQRLLQAQVAERLGNRDEALRSYQFVVDMWRRPDPQLSPYVAEARAGLERLTREGAR